MGQPVDRRSPAGRRSCHANGHHDLQRRCAIEALWTDRAGPTPGFPRTSQRGIIRAENEGAFVKINAVYGCNFKVQ